MLLKVRTPTFVGRTFVLLVNDTDKVSLVKAKLLHVLHDAGYNVPAVRFSYEGSMLNDTHSLKYYGLTNRTLGANKDLTIDAIIADERMPADRDVENALEDEKYELELRERLTVRLKWTAAAYFVAGFLLYFTDYWWFGLISAVVCVFGYFSTPTFDRTIGLIGASAVSVNRLYLFMALCVLSGLGYGVAVFFLVRVVVRGQCFNALTCDTARTIFSAVTYVLGAGVSLFMAVDLGMLFRNLSFNTGDYVTPVLTKTTNIPVILETARSDEPELQRAAALELSNLCSIESNRTTLIDAGAVRALMHLALSSDDVCLSLVAESLSHLTATHRMAACPLMLADDGVNLLYLLLHTPSAAYYTLKTLARIAGQSDAYIAILCSLEGDESGGLSGGAASSSITDLVSGGASVASVGSLAATSAYNVVDEIGNAYVDWLDEPKTMEAAAETVLALLAVPRARNLVAGSGLGTLVDLALTEGITETTKTVLACCWSALSSDNYDVLPSNPRGIEAAVVLSTCTQLDGQRNAALLFHFIALSTNPACLVDPVNTLPSILRLVRSMDRDVREQAASALIHLNKKVELRNTLISQGVLDALSVIVNDRDESDYMFHLKTAVSQLRAHAKLQRIVERNDYYGY